MADLRKHPEDQTAPEEMATQKKAEIDNPGRAKKALPTLGRKGDLKGAEDDEEEDEARASGQGERGQVHGTVSILLRRNRRAANRGFRAAEYRERF
jgi:hypothetical protein